VSTGHFLDEMRKDFLTDGTTTELNVAPKAGDSITPAYGAQAASTGLRKGVNPDLNPEFDDGTATWFSARYAGNYWDFATASLYGAMDYAMNYSVTYLDVAEDMDDVVFAAGSDDAMQILLDGTEIWSSTLSRGFGGFTDLPPAQSLTAGVHMLMVKTFNGVGGFDQGVRIQDSLGVPIVAGVCVSLNPEGCGGITPPPQIFVFTGDVNGDKAVNIADAVKLLQYLFASGVAPTCGKAADANDDDAINIGDAVKILGYLFGGGTMNGPDGSIIKAPANPASCKGYAATGKDAGTNKPWFPATIGTLPICGTQCK
jgi:hypothetical protein